MVVFFLQTEGQFTRPIVQFATSECVFVPVLIGSENALRFDVAKFSRTRELT